MIDNHGNHDWRPPCDYLDCRYFRKAVFYYAIMGREGVTFNVRCPFHPILNHVKVMSLTWDEYLVARVLYE